MNLPNPIASDSTHNEDSGDIQIKFWKILAFLIQQSQRLILGASIGLIIGLVLWFSMGTYKAQVNVPNQWGGIAELRALEVGWAMLAGEMSNDSSLSIEEQSIYRTLSSTTWWNNSLTPNYGLTRTDLKNLVGSNEIKSSPILNIEVSLVSKNIGLLKGQLLQVVDFMHSASSYLAIRDQINTYEAEVVNQGVSLIKDLRSEQLNLIMANRRLTNLEGLQKRFPGNSSITSYLIDSKESGFKYLPISTQVIGAKNDIFLIQDKIEGLESRFEQTQLISQFTGEAKSLLLKEKNGDKLTQELLAIEAQMRATIVPNNLVQLVVLDRIRMDLTKIQFQFMKKKDQAIFPIIQRNSSWAIAAASGLFGGFFFALFICVSLRYWPALKARALSANNKP